jgi:hypothetical protein
MKKLLGIILILLLAAPALAGPIVSVGNPPASSTVAGITMYCTDGITTVGSSTTCATTPANITAKMEAYPPVTIVSTTATQTLPAATVGLKRLYTTDANAVVMTVAPPSGKQIVYDRALLTADYVLKSDGIAYATLFCECVVANVWACYPNSGAFSSSAP